MNRFDSDYCPQIRDVRRLGYVPEFSHASSIATCGAVGSTRCHGIFGSGDKNQSTYNTQQGASEDAQQNIGAGSVAGKDNAVTLGGSFNTNSINTGVTTAAGGNTVLGGVSLGGANSGSITVNGAAGVEEATKQFSATLDNVTRQSSETVATALEKVSSLAESKQTDGISSLGKIALWGLGILAAGGVAYAVLSKSK